MIPAREALQRLRDGNHRFVAGTSGFDADRRRERLHSLASTQEPFAVVLGCSDSRVPPEIVFDQDLGDLFVVRAAGNVAASTQIGSIEFAVSQLKTRLVMVLGHSRCGGVTAALNPPSSPEGISAHLRAILDLIRPAVEAVTETPSSGPEERLQQAVRANVRVSADRLRRESEVLRTSIERDGLLIVGAEYSLETGVVEMFDGMPDQR